jgi:enamine deaminase RidA (YjgF/YER057c/UK114 family)
MSTVTGSALIRSSLVPVGDEALLVIACAPDEAALSFDDQLASLEEAARRELAARGFETHDVMTQRYFLSDVASQASLVRAARASEAAKEGSAPALTLIGQPPATPGRLCEMQLMAVRGEGAPLRAALGVKMGGLSLARVRVGGARMVFISGAGAGGRPATAEEEAAAMYAQAERALALEGLSFQHVIRTWIYLQDIDRDYAALNRARREFYASRRIAPPPASTGIGGVPDGGRCGLDLVAVAWDTGRPLNIMHASTMNEAPTYGADFSRGARVELDGRTLLYVSGTASIDPQGRVAHVGDIAGQTRCMLDNVTDLLARQGTGPQAIVQAVTYLKEPRFLEPFTEALADKGYPAAIPHTLCVADVCRHSWLCEMEALAVI